MTYPEEAAPGPLRVPLTTPIGPSVSTLRDIQQQEKAAAEATARAAADERVRYEAMRDATCAVLLAIRRSGRDVVTGWTIEDVVAAEDIGARLLALHKAEA